MYDIYEYSDDYEIFSEMEAPAPNEEGKHGNVITLTEPEVAFAALLHQRRTEQPS